jgi:MFS family permease
MTPGPPTVLSGVGARSWAVALLLASASFLVLFDSLAVATALPAIGEEFRLRPGVLQWVVSLYSLSIGAFLVLGGRVCDVWGRRRVMMAGLAVCTVAGLVAGLAPNLPLLLGGRALQGIAAAFAIPAALSTAAGEFDTEPWRSRVFSVIAFAAWAAGLAGAMLGGVLTTQWGWRWVFLVTVPIGAAALVATRTLLPADPPGAVAGQRLNVAGAVLVSAGLIAVLLALQEARPARAAAVVVPPCSAPSGSCCWPFWSWSSAGPRFPWSSPHCSGRAAGPAATSRSGPTARATP